MSPSGKIYKLALKKMGFAFAPFGLRTPQTRVLVAFSMSSN
jgi:hypothetical protein